VDSDCCCVVAGRISLTLRQLHIRQALRMAMADASNVEDPALRLDYRALFQTVDKHASSVLSKPDREQVAVWVLRTVLQNKLLTDDNYEVRVGLAHVGNRLHHLLPTGGLNGVSVLRRQFNKVVAEVQQHIEKLPPWEPFQAPVDVDSQPPPPAGTQRCRDGSEVVTVTRSSPHLNAFHATTVARSQGHRQPQRRSATRRIPSDSSSFCRRRRRRQRRRRRRSPHACWRRSKRRLPALTPSVTTAVMRSWCVLERGEGVKTR
jgi:hypothetical protein